MCYNRQAHSSRGVRGAFDRNHVSTAVNKRISQPNKGLFDPHSLFLHELTGTKTMSRWICLNLKCRVGASFSSFRKLLVQLSDLLRWFIGNGECVCGFECIRMFFFSFIAVQCFWFAIVGRNLSSTTFTSPWHEVPTFRSVRAKKSFKYWTESRIKLLAFKTIELIVQLNNNNNKNPTWKNQKPRRREETRNTHMLDVWFEHFKYQDKMLMFVLLLPLLPSSSSSSWN